MPSAIQLRERLLKKLKELFQLDQPDLDFGFYRIMHAKARQVSEFIEKDLFKIVDDAFGQNDNTRTSAAKAEYEKAIQTAIEFGAPEPENTPAVKEARAKYETVKDTASAEADVYDHLYRFFERYYDAGDFISRRYYTRETPGKAAPFAIPYNGEEVKLHWANADQYYIKTTEYFTNFTFDLWQAKEIRAQGFFSSDSEENKSLKVHFRIMDATEGEHGNIKAGNDQKRFFLIYKAKPVEINEAGEIVVNFEYRPDPEKSGQEGTLRDKRNTEAVETILAALTQKSASNKGVKNYLQLLKMAAPTDSDKNRPLLAKYVNQYTARNTMDYFIHKDLGGFLRRELDFYIKNEVIHLDDIENAEAPAVESYLAKIKVLRKIAGKLIDFLAQLEDFQKKLWLKKKFVLETNYCITLDKIDESFFPEILANEAQRQEWEDLYAIDAIENDLINIAYSDPLTIEFLKQNKALVLDTKHFNAQFKEKLVASINSLDEEVNGLLIHSENYQALNFLQERYRETVKCVYLDPPYNTDAAPIIYKNGYKDSSWLSLITDRLLLSKKFMVEEGIKCITIDDVEFNNLSLVVEAILNKDNILGYVVIKNNPSGRSTAKGFSISHEYAIFAAKNVNTIIGRLSHSDNQLARYKFLDEIGPFEWVNFRKHGGANANRYARPKLYYPIIISSTSLRFPDIVWNAKNNVWDMLEQPKENEKIIYPITPEGEEKTWKWGIDTARSNPNEFTVRKDQTGELGVYRKARLNEDGTLPLTVWDKPEYSSTEHGTNLLKRIFGKSEKFSFPKSVFAVVDSLRVCNCNSSANVLDYFAGSGTTGHAVINLNREDGGNRKYILVEMGDYFDTVLKPRIAKVVYSESWKDGKPTARHTGISHCFKYIRLESYEDTLNNLRFDDNPSRDKVIAAGDTLREDYMLHYLLDVETRGSQSLLNIDAFTDPTAYTLKVKKPGSDEYAVRNVDLLETFNYLIGLRVVHIAEPQVFSAAFKRVEDKEVPVKQKTKLVIDGKMKKEATEYKTWWFREVEGWVPKDPSNPNNGQREKVLIVWRKLTGDLEKDNLMLDEWFRENRISSHIFDFDVIYVNGSNNLQNLARSEDSWKVRLLEEEFMKCMWDTEGV
jgi:adenine-specific DNA-methyltransferase